MLPVSVFNGRILKNIYLGLCFMILFSAFHSLTSTQKTITASIEKDDPSCHLDGYASAAIGYIALSLGMWFAPAIIAKTGPKYAMVFSVNLYLIFFITLFTERALWIYLGSAISGFGGSILWTGQANYIVLNSEIGKVYSGISVFWMLYQSSHFFGNAIIYWLFNDIPGSIDKPTRIQIESTLVAFTVIGMLMMFGIRPPLRNDEYKKIIRSPFNEILKSTKILAQSRMSLMIATMISTGLHLAFMSILSAAMSFSTCLSDNSKELAPLSGIVQGIGEILGAFSSVLLGSRTIFKMKPLITVALICNLTCYSIFLLALPNNSAHFFTNDLPLVPLPIWIVLMAALLSGVGDACLHTQLYDSLGYMYPNDSASAFAVFKFIRCVATASSFYYSKYLGLHVQIVILISCSVISWLIYHYVQCFTTRSESNQEQLNEQPLTGKQQSIAEKA